MRYLCILPWISDGFYESGENIGKHSCRKGLLEGPENLKGSPGIVSRRTRKCGLQSNFTKVMFQMNSFCEDEGHKEEEAGFYRIQEIIIGTH